MSVDTTAGARAGISHASLTISLQQIVAHWQTAQRGSHCMLTPNLLPPTSSPQPKRQTNGRPLFCTANWQKRHPQRSPQSHTTNTIRSERLSGSPPICSPKGHLGLPPCIRFQPDEMARHGAGVGFTSGRCIAVWPCRGYIRILLSNFAWYGCVARWLVFRMDHRLH